MARKSKREGSTTAASTVANSRGLDRDFNPDYSPVIKDLRRIALLAGTFFTVLIVLSFFL